ncbi:MAG: 1-deoxy-D-xylulose-5-phosphate synthase, partial [Gammaproteobacteria bacterium]|nr:1-deoxy-D-xylulose-5-phosphate synthase [Gammaproteobacteria bacterium]
KGESVALLAFGSVVASSLEAAESLNATVADMRFVKPIDDELITALAGSHDLLVTIEENACMGGAGSAVQESLAAQGITIPVLQLGLPDHFVNHGDTKALLAECGLDSSAIIRAVENRRADDDCMTPSRHVK